MLDPTPQLLRIDAQQGGGVRAGSWLMSGFIKN